MRFTDFGYRWPNLAGYRPSLRSCVSVVGCCWTCWKYTTQPHCGHLSTPGESDGRTELDCRAETLAGTMNKCGAIAGPLGTGSRPTTPDPHAKLTRGQVYTPGASRTA